MTDPADRNGNHYDELDELARLRWENTDLRAQLEEAQRPPWQLRHAPGIADPVYE